MAQEAYSPKVLAAGGTGVGHEVLLPVDISFNYNVTPVFFFFFFNFIFKLYIIVLVLPTIKMNPPQVYMCSPS